VNTVAQHVVAVCQDPQRMHSVCTIRESAYPYTGMALPPGTPACFRNTPGTSRMLQVVLNKLRSAFQL